jgi:hypothetical protein
MGLYSYRNIVKEILDIDMNLILISGLSHSNENALMRYSIKDTNFLILKQAHDALVREWEEVKREFYARKFDSTQPRDDQGRWTDVGGGQWTAEPAATEATGSEAERAATETTGSGTAAQDSGDDLVQNILEKARKLTAGAADMKRCIDLCHPLLERFQRPGSDRNEFDFRKCLNACLGLNLNR